MEAMMDGHICTHHGSLSPTNVDEDFLEYAEQYEARQNRSQVAGSPQTSPAGNTMSIVAMAKEFQDAKLSEIRTLILNKVPIVLVTTRSWEYVPLMFDGLHFVYEGYIQNVQTEGNIRNFTVRLEYPKRKMHLSIQISSPDVVSLLPRYGQRNRSEECSYFHLHGHCAFGLNCHKAHDPRKLCEKVKDRLRAGDIKILNENQQHTLHIAMVEEGVTEFDMRTLFETFGPLKSVKIEAGKSLLQGQGWRIGFVTYQYAKDAIKAKKTLNEDPKSRFRGLIQFSKQPTKNHACNQVAVSNAVDVTLPRQTCIPRLDRPTEQIYLHRSLRNQPTTAHCIKNLLDRHELTKFVDVTVSPNCDYGLVLFDDIQTSVIAMHKLLEFESSSWVLDFQPVEDRTHLKLNYRRWLALRRNEASLMSIIGNYWVDASALDEELKSGICTLHQQLFHCRRELYEIDDCLTKLVFQAARQANTQLQRDSPGTSLGLVQLAAAIGPEAVAFTEEKSGSLRDFIDAQRHGLSFVIEEHNLLTEPAKTVQIVRQATATPTRQAHPALYSGLFDHVSESKEIPAALIRQL
mmetsp:Transcript_41562/g.111453  ORF Transcript_41562/g.111453 Transcript_41562/m.111453 type:complete len:574 (-) Transcript_41562:119-1840(-)